MPSGARRNGEEKPVVTEIPIRPSIERRARPQRWAVAALTLTLFFGLAQGCKSQPSAHDACSVANAACPYVARLLAQREGYGRNATGGLNGAVAVVTSSADSGPGTLRDIMERARQPVWIRFGQDMTIQLQSAVHARSNMTIDGRGHMVTVTDYGFSVGRVNNIIITHLTIDGRSETLGKAVILGAATNVWLDHLDLSRFNDRLIDVKEGSGDVTLSWIKFHDDNKVMLLNNVVGGADKDLFKDYDRDSVSRVTLHHNYFLNTVQRNPRAVIGNYHLFNNLLENWDFYGMAFSLEARALLEGNVFDNISARQCMEPQVYHTIEDVDRNYCHGIPTAGQRSVLNDVDRKMYDGSNPVYHYTHDSKAFLMFRDNLFLHDAQSTATDYKPESVPKPPYCYSYQTANAALEDEIRKDAGNTPYDTTLPLTRCP
jgi:pectate lyase